MTDEKGKQLATQLGALGIACELVSLSLILAVVQNPELPLWLVSPAAIAVATMWILPLYGLLIFAKVKLLRQTFKVSFRWIFICLVAGGCLILVILGISASLKSGLPQKTTADVTHHLPA